LKHLQELRIFAEGGCRRKWQGRRKLLEVNQFPLLA